MENKKTASVPYTVYEAEQVRNAKLVRMLCIVIIVCVLALVGTNLAWVIYEKQFEVVEETTTTVTEHESIYVEQDNENGNNNFIGHDGDITNG